MTRWDQIYAEINADTINRDIVTPHFRVTASVSIPNPIVSNEREMRPVLAGAMAGHFRVTNRTSIAPDEEDCYTFARQYLERAYYSEGAYEAAYEACRLGKDGGLYGVLAKLRDYIIRQDTEVWIGKVINRYVDLLSYRDRVAVAREVRSTFRRFMSPEDRAMSEGEMAMKVDALIRSLTQALDQARDSLRQL